MKAIFIAFDQAHYNTITTLLEKRGCRGFTAWQEVQGRGSNTGEPHFGSHAWPSLASAIITFVADDAVAGVLDELHRLDQESPRLGLRAFTWQIDQSI